MRFALFLAWAHIWRRPLQSALAVLGVGVGVGVLLVALSLANGFMDGLVRATLKAYPQLVLFSLEPTLPPLPSHPEVEAARAHKRMSVTLRANPCVGADPHQLLRVHLQVRGVHH